MMNSGPVREKATKRYCAIRGIYGARSFYRPPDLKAICMFTCTVKPSRRADQPIPLRTRAVVDNLKLSIRRLR